MKVTEFTNVVLSADLVTHLQKNGMSPDVVFTHCQLEPVIAKLAVLYPLWTFTGGGSLSSTANNVWLTSFTVSCDGEKLGAIERRYEGRDYHICVTNDRIKAKLERSNYYKTLSADKAVAKVKKMFNPKTIKEIAESVRGRAASVAQSAEWNKNREMSEANDIVQRAAKKYVMGAGFDTFMAYVKDNYPAQEYDLLVSKHELATRAKEELETISATKNVISTQKEGAIVVRRGHTYVVEEGDKLEICDDNTLPEWIRGQIGMLKLIEPEQFVSDLGMRASDSVFVLIKPKQENLTTVSEGETK